MRARNRHARTHRIDPRSRAILTATALAILFAGASFAGAGTASASTIVANGCTGSVTGAMDDQVAVSGPALRGLVRQSAQESVTLLSLLTVQPDVVADEIARKSSIAVGSIPHQAKGQIPGNVVGAAVASALSNANGLGLLPATRQSVLGHIQQRVSDSCGLITVATNVPAPSTPGSTVNNPISPSAATTQPRTEPAAPGSSQPSSGSPEASGAAGVPGSSTPPGTKTDNPGQPGQPGQQFTVLDPTTPPAGPEIENTGEAHAVNASSSSGALGLPVLIAVLALAGVSAALVRSWVLRKN